MAKSTKKFSLSQLKKQDRMVIRVGRDSNVERVIFPNPLSVGLDADGLRSALTVEGGIKLNVEVPSSTDSMLYNNNGKLYFHGAPVLVTDTEGKLSYDTSSKKLSLEGTISSTNISGSLQKLSDGTDYLRAGDRVQIAQNVDGSITITADAQQSGIKATATIVAIETSPENLSNDTLIIQDADSHTVTFTYSTSEISPTKVSATAYKIGVQSVNTTALHAARIKDALDLAKNNGDLNITPSLSGDYVSLVQDSPGTSGNNTITGTAVSGAEVNINGFSGGEAGSGDTTAQYLTLATSAKLTNERVFTAGSGISVTDAGAGGTYTVAVNSSTVPFLGSNQTFTGVNTFTGEIKGSHQLLADGTDAFVAGSNVQITKEADGSITIAATDTNTDTTYVAGDGISLTGNTFAVSPRSSSGLKLTSGQLAIETTDIAGTGLSDDGFDRLKVNIGTNRGLDFDGNALVVSPGGLSGTGLTADGNNLAINDNIVATISGSTFTGGVKFNTGLTGSLSSLPSGKSFIAGGNDITVTTSSDGQVIITSNASINNTYTAGTGLTVTGYEFSIRTDITVTTSGNKFVMDGATAPVIAASKNGVFYFDVSHASNAGKVLRFSTTKDGTHDSGSEYTTGLTSSGTPGNSGAFVKLVTNQATPDTLYYFNTATANYGNALLTSPKSTGAITETQTYQGDVKFNQGLTGSLQNLTSGISYLKGSGAITVTTASNGQVTVHSDGDISAVSAGTGMTGGGSSGAVTLGIDDRVVATISGSVFSGVTKHNAGLSGSLTQLADGTSYIVAGTNITIASSSNGQIKISTAGGVGGTSYTAGDGLDLDGASFALDLKSGGGLKIDSSELAINDDLVATISGSTFTGATKFSAGLSGSLTHLSDGTSFIRAGSSLKVTTGSSGFVTVDISDTGVQIGPAEDSVYSDGLFTDFAQTTRVGTAIDRFNEILKSLAPGSAPNLDNIDCNDTGVSAKLSFGNAQSISGYTNSSTTAGFSAVDINGTYTASSSGNNLRRGVFNKSTVIDGDLNEDVTADTHSNSQVNYPANSFGNADQGTLKLEVNGSVVHSVVLTGSDLGHVGAGNPGSGSGSSVNSNSSGFVNLSVTGSSKFEDAASLALFQHRTGKYQIGTADQREGWNYARVVHTISGSDTTTNYVEWVNDSNSNELSIEGTALDTVTTTGLTQLSGVKYFTGATATYKARVYNAYKNVYTSNNITFTTTNCSVPAQSMPSINTGASEDQAKVLHITGTATVTATSLMGGSISTAVNVSHPLKSSLSSAGSRSVSGLLIYNLSNTSTATSETFRAENYRVISGSYNTQASVTDSDNTWSSTMYITGSGTGQENGLMFYNQTLVSPKQGVNSGDFRNSSDGGSLAYGPSDNVNYSSVSGTRTFYRYFQNTTGGSKTDASITINGSNTTIVPRSTSLSTGNIHVLFKLPLSSANFETGWVDMAVAYQTGQTDDGDGCLVGSLDSSLNATNQITFGTNSVRNNEYILVMIEADATWTGNISSISLSWV
ncbi:hypothetical protein CMK19_01165 [Candidatus Poribacteria bacterium]|nr:hypothetical protein [Candidatus Poribacteria bacterium]